MTGLKDMKRELRERFERLKKGGNPGSNPELGNCLNIRITDEKNIEISFKDTLPCRPLKEKYGEVLEAALVGAETIYKTVPLTHHSGEGSEDSEIWVVHEKDVETLRRIEPEVQVVRKIPSKAYAGKFYMYEVKVPKDKADKLRRAIRR